MKQYAGYMKEYSVSSNHLVMFKYLKFCILIEELSLALFRESIFILFETTMIVPPFLDGIGMVQTEVWSRGG